MSKEKGKLTEDGICRIDDEGNHIPLSPEEQDEARLALARSIQNMKVELAPGVEEQTKEAGLTLDEVLAAFIGNKKN